MKISLNLTGKVFGKWVVLEKIRDNKNRIRYKCKCQCGNTLLMAVGDLARSQQCKSCSKTKDLTGQRFGRLVVIEFIKPTDKSRTYCVCLCNCGNSVEVKSTSLVQGHTKSCGCLHKEVAAENVTLTTHGMSRTATYKTYGSMIQRCYNYNNAQYKNYGARGIKVCEGWLEGFEVFYSDMGEKPKGLSLDRIKNNLHYSCGHCRECFKNNWKLNCRWTTQKEQMRNFRNNVIITINGKSATIAEWSEITGVKHNTITERIKRGWNKEDAVTRPPNNKYSRDRKSVV